MHMSGTLSPDGKWLWNGTEWINVGGASGQSGYSHTGAFADKPTSNNYVWQSGAGVNYTQADVNADTYKVLSLSRSVHDAVDNPYWSTPTPSGISGIGLFQGANLPSGVSTLFDYDLNNLKVHKRIWGRYQKKLIKLLDYNFKTAKEKELIVDFY